MLIYYFRQLAYNDLEELPVGVFDDLESLITLYFFSKAILTQGSNLFYRSLVGNPRLKEPEQDVFRKLTKLNMMYGSKDY